MYQILDGKELARKIREELKLKVDKLKENGIVPKLAVILVGDDSASKVYVKNKSKACKDVGVEFESLTFILKDSYGKITRNNRKIK